MSPRPVRHDLEMQKGDDQMKSMLLSAICMPAALAVGAAAAFAQTPPPAPSPSSPSVTDPAPAVIPAPSDRSALTPSTGGTFSSNQAADEWRSSKLIGMAVYNRANEKVGDINDLILAPDGKISNAVIGVGGFLGMGEKLVAVSFSDLQLNRDADGTMRVTIASSKESLESAPEFKYYSDVQKGK
jgi:sporulation protein YlmC with PRC-barrel domain